MKDENIGKKCMVAVMAMVLIGDAVPALTIYFMLLSIPLFVVFAYVNRVRMIHSEFGDCYGNGWMTESWCVLRLGLYLSLMMVARLFVIMHWPGGSVLYRFSTLFALALSGVMISCSIKNGSDKWGVILTVSALAFTLLKGAAIPFLRNIFQ